MISNKHKFFTKFIKWYLDKKNIYKFFSEKKCEVRSF